MRRILTYLNKNVKKIMYL